MGKKSSKNKIKALTDSDPFGILFRLEDNAGEIFTDYLEKEFSEDILEEKESHPEASGKPSKKEGRDRPVSFTVDLHGLHLDEAIFRADSFIRENQAREQKHRPSITCKIITGKGLHSQNTSVLAGEVYEHVKNTFRKSIIRIDEPPLNNTINGIPIRGYFNVTLKTQG